MVFLLLVVHSFYISIITSSVSLNSPNNRPNVLSSAVSDDDGNVNGFSFVRLFVSFAEKVQKRDKKNIKEAINKGIRRGQNNITLVKKIL